MWERRVYDDAVCTVRYIGTVAPWGDRLALGVEWDDKSRGKNNGEIDGVKYFNCRAIGAGSFIKASRKYETPSDFGSCFHEKYLTNPEFEEIRLSTAKKVETYDVDSMFEFQSTVENLIAINLGGCRISSMKSSINFSAFTNLTKLDLSYNLFASFGEIVNASAEFPKLRTLRLDGNRFDFSDELANTCQPNPAIEELSINNSLLTEDEISCIIASFPNLHTLSIAFNNLERIPPSIHNSSLKVLDISNNVISSLRGLPPSLSQIYASNCSIKSAGLGTEDHIPPLLDLVNNGPFDWNIISVLGARNVKSLSLNVATSIEAITNRPFIITRIPYLQTLDGTSISESERTDAELFTRSCVVKGTHPPLPEYLWASLNDKYGELPLLSENSINARLMKIYIGNSQEPIQVVRDAPMYRLAWCIARREGISKWNLLSLEPREKSSSMSCINLSQSQIVGDALEDGGIYDLIQGI